MLLTKWYSLFKPFGLRKIPIEVTQKEKKESKPYQHTHTHTHKIAQALKTAREKNKDKGTIRQKTVNLLTKCQ